VRSVIARHHALLDSTENSGGPARYVRLARHPGRIGFISQLPQLLRQLQPRR
jgi:cyclic pyranopterin phosphate synthase